MLLIHFLMLDSLIRWISQLVLSQQGMTRGSPTKMLDSSQKLGLAAPRAIKDSHHRKPLLPAPPPCPQSNKSLSTKFSYQNLKLDWEQGLSSIASFSFQQVIGPRTFLPLPSVLTVLTPTRGILRIFLLCFHAHLERLPWCEKYCLVQNPFHGEGDWSQNFPLFPTINLLLAA